MVKINDDTKLLELEDNQVPFSALNDYPDGKELIQGLDQDAFDELITMSKVTTMILNSRRNLK
jgi:hypothetical protein